jgi:tight adherence protein C
MSSFNNFPLVAAGLVFLVILLLFTAMFYYSQYRRKHSKLLDKIRSEGIRAEVDTLTASPLVNQTVRRPFASLLESIGKRLHPDKSRDEFKQRNLNLVRAGIRGSNALAIFWGTKGVLALFLAGVFVSLMPLFRAISPSRALLISLILALIGYYLPELWLRLKIVGRRRKIQEGLPDALDLLVVCVEAGMGLDAALSRVGEEIRLQNWELSDELMLLNFEVRAGKLRRDAMKSLAIRTGLEDINSLITLLIQTEKFGTSVAQALRVYSDTFRSKRAQRAEEIAAKLPVKLMIPLALFIFPSMFVVLLAPAAISIFRQFLQKH